MLRAMLQLGCIKLKKACFQCFMMLSPLPTTQGQRYHQIYTGRNRVGNKSLHSKVDDSFTYIYEEGKLREGAFSNISLITQLSNGPNQRILFFFFISLFLHEEQRMVQSFHGGLFTELFGITFWIKAIVIYLGRFFGRFFFGDS